MQVKEFGDGAVEVSRNEAGEPEVRMTSLLGHVGAMAEGPQTFMIESIEPGRVVRPHFHTVDQFQLFPGGDGTIGKAEIRPVFVHYADAWTPYGPITAGPVGFKYVTVRARSDPGPQYMPEKRRDRQRTGGRYLTFDVPELDEPGVVVVESEHEDGLAVVASRVEADAPVQLHDVRNLGGVHLFCLDGTFVLNGQEYGRLSNIFVEASELLEGVAAGPEGASLIALYFPLDTNESSAA